MDASDTRFALAEFEPDPDGTGATELALDQGGDTTVIQWVSFEDTASEASWAADELRQLTAL